MSLLHVISPVLHRVLDLLIWRVYDSSDPVREQLAYETGRYVTLTVPSAVHHAT